MKKRQYGYTVVSRLSGSRELAIPPVIISAASSLKFIAGFSAHHMYRREKALWPAKNSKPAGQQGSTVLEACLDISTKIGCQKVLLWMNWNCR